MITTKIGSDRRETTGNPTDESTRKEQVMYPLEMDAVMRELCKFVRLSFSVHHRTTRNRRIALKKTNALCR